VIIRKAKKIRDELGVAVPLPDEGQALTQVLLKAILLRRGGRAGSDNAKQLQLFEESWEEAAARSKRGRATVFAQRRLKPEEVLPEWHKTIVCQCMSKSDSTRTVWRGLFSWTSTSRLPLGVAQCSEPTRLSQSWQRHCWKGPSRRVAIRLTQGSWDVWVAGSPQGSRVEPQSSFCAYGTSW
jgi:hypothetical protein